MNKKLIGIILAGAVGAGGVGLILNEARADIIDDTVDAMSLEELAGTPETPETPVEPTLTARKVQDIVSDLIHPERHNGILGIARNRGVSVQQVRRINQRRLERIRELTPAEGQINP